MHGKINPYVLRFSPALTLKTSRSVTRSFYSWRLSRQRRAAQAYERELNISAKALLMIKNRTGRVSVIASDDEKSRSSLKASSAGASVATV